MITSDNRKGLTKAKNKYFQGITCRRWQTHFSRNMLDKTPKKIQPELKQDLRMIYEAIELLDISFDDIISVIMIPLKYWKRLRTTNGVDRLNQKYIEEKKSLEYFLMMNQWLG